MAYLVFILTVLLFIALFLYIQLRKEIKEVARQLQYTRKEKSSFHFFTTSSNKYMKTSVEEINILREENQRITCAYMDNERKTQEMIANISHDIRTPLTSIQGYVEMIQNSDIAMEGERYYHIVMNRLNDLESMLDEFFLYAKIMNSSELYTLEEKEIYPLICKTILYYMELLKKHNLLPEVICEDESLSIKLHEESFIRICTNLIVNTVRYGKNPFRIEIKNVDEHLCISFENKCDVATNIDVEHMFDRFFKGNQARNQKGSGLGLAIVKELCERMNACVDAQYYNQILKITILF